MQRVAHVRAAAQTDIDEAIGYYQSSAGSGIAINFVDDLEQSLSMIADHAEVGSTRHAEELHIPGLRSWHLNNFPYIVFYNINETSISVWRVLHDRRDIHAFFASSEQTNQ